MATIGVGAAAAFGSRDAAPDRAIVERIGYGNTVRWTVTSPAQVAQLYRDTVGLTDAPTGVYACPAIASLYHYRVTFLAGSDVVLLASFDPGGCRIVDLHPGGARQANGPAGERFWGDLALAMGIRAAPCQKAFDGAGLGSGRRARAPAATTAAPAANAATTRTNPAVADSAFCSSNPAPRNPSGPVDEIAVMVEVITVGRSSAGVRIVIAAKNLGKNRPEQRPLAATERATAQAGISNSSGTVAAAMPTTASVAARSLVSFARAESRPPITDPSPYEARNQPASRAPESYCRRASTGSVASIAVNPISMIPTPITRRSNGRSRAM